MAARPTPAMPSGRPLAASLALACGLLLLPGPARAAQEGQLSTRWGAGLDRSRVHPEHPKPQFQRADWLSLNGEWDYAVQPLLAPPPGTWQGKILVPFPIESALSGVQRRVADDQVLRYRRPLVVPPEWRGQRLLLHFGAVDWQATVSVDGQAVGSHQGGYDPFQFELDGALADGRPHELEVAVWDPTDRGPQPRGKQVTRPGGIWYTPTTGIWQSVWLEAVPPTYLADLELRGSYLQGALELEARADGPVDGLELEVVARLGSTEAFRARGVFAGDGRLRLIAKVPEPQPWSPDSPTLYDLELLLRRGEQVVDRVQSYFGLRDIQIGPDDAGTPRILLNGEVLFQFGPLDQGFWPDGLYTAPSDEALRYDLEVTKRLGFNMVRKHVKVEPDRWYSWCDRLGLLVWQDMPSGDRYIGPGDADYERDADAERIYFAEHQELVRDFGNHPSIVVWVPFNEGWGQFATARVVDWLRRLDPTRLVDSASGWADRGVGDLHDIHAYPGPAAPPVEPGRAAVLGEFGGLGLPLPGHTWQDQENWGYRSFEDAASLTAAYLGLIGSLRPLIHDGLCAAVYTQTTDVEVEVNGLMSYDRAVLKMDPAAVREANLKLYLPPPTLRPVLESSRLTPQPWAWTTEAPADGWPAKGFDDAGWQRGLGGFGRPGTPGAVIATEWLGADIWLRRGFIWKGPLPEGDLHLRIHHDEDAEVWLNGQLIAELAGYTTGYLLLPLGADARALIQQGVNQLAVHCRQTGGGQFIDAGLVAVSEREPEPGEH